MFTGLSAFPLTPITASGGCAGGGVTSTSAPWRNHRY